MLRTQFNHFDMIDHPQGAGSSGEITPIGVLTLDQIHEQISREPRKLPKLIINPDVKDIRDFKYEDFQIVDYDPWPAIKGKVSV